MCVFRDVINFAMCEIYPCCISVLRNVHKHAHFCVLFQQLIYEVPQEKSFCIYSLNLGFDSRLLYRVLFTVLLYFMLSLVITWVIEDDENLSVICLCCNERFLYDYRQIMLILKLSVAVLSAAGGIKVDHPNMSNGIILLLKRIHLLLISSDYVYYSVAVALYAFGDTNLLMTFFPWFRRGCGCGGCDISRPI